MKKLIVIVMALILCAGVLGCKKPVMAELNLPDLLKKLPALNQSVIYSIPDSEFDYATSVTLVSLLSDKVKVDVGYSPSSQVLGLVSFKLVEVKDYIKFPILDLVVIEPFVWAGFNRIEDLKEFGEANYGVGAKIVSIKF